jgi:hypothetical protein
MEHASGGFVKTPARYIWPMTERRMTWRIVALGSAEAGDSRLGATATERLQMLAELSRLAWSASGRPFPEYARSEMPVRLTTLRHRDPPGAG